MNTEANVLELSSWTPDADREEADALEDAELGGPGSPSERGDLVHAVHFAATLLGLGVPSSRIW